MQYIIVRGPTIYIVQQYIEPEPCAPPSTLRNLLPDFYTFFMFSILFNILLFHITTYINLRYIYFLYSLSASGTFILLDIYFKILFHIIFTTIEIPYFPLSTRTAITNSMMILIMSYYYDYSLTDTFELCVA